MRLRSYFSGMMVVSAALLLSAPANAENYNQLINKARNGEIQPALHFFQQQKSLSPDRVADWLQISLWSQDDNQVISVYERYKNLNIPDRGLSAAAMAYRNIQQWDNAIQLWENILKHQPADDDYRRGYIMTLADAGLHDHAISQITTLTKNKPIAENYRVQAYVYQRAGQPENELLSLTLSQMYSESTGELSDVQNFTLQRNHLAARVNNPGDDIIRADAAAELVKLSFYPSRSEQDRYHLADQALAACDTLLEEWKNTPQTAAHRQVSIDRLGALRSRDRTAEVIAGWEQLKRDGVIVPDYALYWVASALLAERRPAEAESIMMQLANTQDAINRLEPEDRALLFYSHLENERLQQAKSLTSLTRQSHPWQRNIYGSPTPQPNDHWFQGQQFSVGVDRYGNDLPRAEERANMLARSAPGNQGLRIDYASVLLTRGLPRHAEWELKKAEALEPRNIRLEAEQAWVAADLQEWRAFSQLTDDVVRRAPEDAQVQQLQRGLEIHRKAELRVDGSVGIDSDSPDAGHNDFTVNTVIYSPPVNENWRAFAGYSFARGGFSEGKERLHNGLGGVEWRSRDITLDAQASAQHVAGKTRAGARFSAQYAFTDHWHLYADAERLSNRTPLRALHHGITANGGSAALTWYQNERREYSLAAAITDFSDGNLRQEYALSGKERLWTSPRVSLDLLPTLGFETNSQQDGPYFHPEKGVTLLPALRAEHLITRHYDTVWQQEFIGGAGSYWQENHGNGAVLQAGYGQRVFLNNVANIGARLMWEKRPWDGEQEKNLSLAFDMNFRF
ncbi:poly-beta-1,6 N-acetyl-D-glucosamine export porin PgaA [Citrobacter sp. NCU1]|uniref:poly-beta-1,6 N-acetyl-D-glucosamine export porin PgaA n=1 Tax=Citrobacter sp. NCU1 TaxID=2026683 RepID=UPI0013916821|nr:poly-beta-1,6 N-acetyl-D-glucosamine export porin PgaA [Citrobacter sp. NCU1]